MDGDYPTPEARKLFYDRLLRELSELGPVRGGGAHQPHADGVLGQRARSRSTARSTRRRRDRPNANFEQVTGSFFEVTGQKLLEGRTFADDDLDAKQPVAIVNAAFAKKHFGTESAVGRRFRTATARAGRYGPWRTIVGVVSTVRMHGAVQQPERGRDRLLRAVLRDARSAPRRPTSSPSQFATVVVKPRAGQQAESVLNDAAARGGQGRPEPAALLRRARRSSTSTAPVAAFRIIASMFTIFGAVAIVLAAVGHLRRDVVRGQPAAAGVRRAHGARRRQRADPGHGAEAGLAGRSSLGLAVGIGPLAADRVPRARRASTRS